MSPLALVLLLAAAAPKTAVADLSVRPEPAIAEALRGLPDLAGEPLPAKKAAMVVSDAARLGIVCSISDARCLQKILVLARVDELIAFEVSGRSLSIARVTARTATFAKARKGASGAASARAAWAALARAASESPPAPRAPLDEPPPVEERAPEEPGDADEAAADEDEPAGAPRRQRAARAPLDETETATSEGLTLPLVVAASGAGAAVLLGAATLGVSAVVANQIRATEQDVPLDASYDAMNTTFWVLAGLTGAALATSAVAGAIFLAEGAEPGAPPSEP